jgi:LmbE family N-acetylglucosaminyl deacetylase
MNLQADRQATWRLFLQELRTKPASPSLRPLVLAAHPDDETIGASLVLARFPESVVVFLTDGAPRDRALWSDGAHGSREAYAETRRAEAFRALAHAGVSSDRTFWLQAVDQEAIFEICRLAQLLSELIKKLRPHIVITHSYEGGHPDHDAAAVVAKVATSQLDHPPSLLEMTSYHARDGHCVTGEFLESKLSPEVRFELSDDDRDRKARMMQAYLSQRLVLKSFPINCELSRLAPDCDFSQPPHPGKLWYECMGWPMTGKLWREVATASLRAQEHSCR